MSEKEKKKPELTKEQKQQAKEYGKRVNKVLKELKKKAQPKSIKERIGYNMMMTMFIAQVVEYVEHNDPQKTKEAIETLIKRFMWIIE